MVNNTQYLTGGKSPNPLEPPSNFLASPGNAKVTLTWTDPPNATVEPSGQTYATWAYTQVVRKEGSQPTGPHDGIVVVQSSVRDQYATNGFVDTGLTNNTLYYYGAFAYNSDKVVSEGAFASAMPQAGTPLGELTEGTLITINENGSPVEFFIGKHNYEPGLNDEGRTLVVREVAPDASIYSSKLINTYASSSLSSYLNGSYYNRFSERVKELIGTTKFYYTVGGSDRTLTTLERHVFTPSLTEFGFTSSYVNVEGSTLPIASLLGTIECDEVISPATQWTRTPEVYGPNASNDPIAYLTGTGSFSFSQAGYLRAIRACFTLPSTTLVDSNLALIETT